MTIRQSVNQSFERVTLSNSKSGLRYNALGGASEGAAVTLDIRPLDTPPTFLTTVPSGAHNGPKE